MSTTAPKTVDGSRPYCWEVADETRQASEQPHTDRPRAGIAHPYQQPLTRGTT